jgi:predicted kinase
LTGRSQRILSGLTLPQTTWQRPVLIGVMGLPCTGKTEVSAHLAARLPLLVLSTDQIRLAHHLPSGPAVHQVMRSVASVLLSRRISVVFDGIHLHRAHRTDLRHFAAGHAARFELVYTTAGEAVIEERLRVRKAAPARTSSGGSFAISPDHFERIRQYLEPPTPLTQTGWRRSWRRSWATWPRCAGRRQPPRRRDPYGW